jgi:hypothetical protein
VKYPFQERRQTNNKTEHWQHREKNERTAQNKRKRAAQNEENKQLNIIEHADHQ